MVATLYRQYRPQQFKDVAGQEQAVKTLTRALTEEKIAHAYLFHGPRGTGKTTMARLFAKRLNCLKPKKAEPCSKCVACVAMQAGTSNDVIEIDAASNRGIDDIRSLKETINQAPSLGKYRVYIIDEVHMLTREAFTALLKTLEEPAAHVVFILATTEFHKVPETVLSRCQIYRFRRATESELTERLQYILKQEKRRVDDAALAFIIDRSDGCFRDAESLLGQALALHDKKITLADISGLLGLPPRDLIERLMAALVAGNAREAVTAIDEAFAEGFDPEQVIAECVRAGRDASLHIISGETSSWQFASNPAALPRLPILLRALIQAGQDLAFVPEPLVALHLAVLSVCADTAAQAAPAALRQPQSVAQPRRAEVATTSKPATLKEATPAPATSAPKPAPQPVVTVEASEPEAGASDVQKIWPALIDAIKHENPVASTFLRAMTPVGLTDQAVRIQASYALHRSFFEKNDNRALLAKYLSKLLEREVEVRIMLQEQASAAPQRLTQKDQEKQEQELLETVKEIFGQPAQG